MTALRVAVIGAGTMGAAVTRRLLAAGAAVDVWNRSAAPTHALAGLGAEAAAGPDGIPVTRAIARRWRDLADRGLAGLDVSAARLGVIEELV